MINSSAEGSGVPAASKHAIWPFFLVSVTPGNHGILGVPGQMMRKNFVWKMSHDLHMGESKFTALYEVPALSRSKFRYFVQLMYN